MDHKQQHHEHHRHERELKKQREHEFERRQEQNTWPIHPKWLLVIAFGAILASVLVWTFIVW